MNILIDTAVRGCNVALFHQNEILGVDSEDIERGHAEALLSIYESLICKAGKTSNDITNIFVTVGPGSFTGLRVGLSVARFMAFSLQKSVYGITTFQAFSCGLEEKMDRLILVETKRSDYYCQIFDCDHIPLNQPQCLDMQSVINIIDEYKADIIITGDAVERFQTEISEVKFKYFSQPRINIEKLIYNLQTQKLSLSSASAVYIRDADVSMKSK